MFRWIWLVLGGGGSDLLVIVSNFGLVDPLGGIDLLVQFLLAIYMM